MVHDETNTLVKIPKNGTRFALIFFVINFLLVFANLYLSNGYVARSTYEADVKERLNKDDKLNENLHLFTLDISRIKDHMEGDIRQDDKLKDLESRMREQEKKR